ncbi:MAG: portal protein [Geminicoccaceae bacterium]
MPASFAVLGSLASHAGCLSWTFGTRAVLVMPGGWRLLPIAMIPRTYVAENAAGHIDQVYRRYWQTARQMAQHFGEDALPDPIAKCLADKPEERFRAAAHRPPGRWLGTAGSRSMTFESWHLTVQHRLRPAPLGLPHHAYAVSRYVTAPGEVYGRSPARTLPDIKMADRMSRTIIDRANLAAEPPLLSSTTICRCRC